MKFFKYSLQRFASTKELKKLFFFIGSDGSKRIAKKKANESIKRELLNSLLENDDVEELNETINNVNNCQYLAIFIIHRYNYIVNTQMKKSNRAHW